MIIRKVKLKKDVRSFLDEHPECQIVDEDVVGSERHVKYALSCVDRAFKQRRNFSKKKSIELLLWLTGQRQIFKALEKGRPKKIGVFVGGKRDFDEGIKKGYFEDAGKIDKKENELDFIEKSALLWLETKRAEYLV